MSEQNQTRNEVERIARKRNGSVTSDDLFELVLAVAHDDERRHHDSQRIANELTQRLDEHLVQCGSTGERIELLERRADGQLATTEELRSQLAGRQAQAPGEQASAAAAAGAESGEPRAPGRSREGFTREQIMWAVGVFLVTIVCNAGLTYLIIYYLDKAIHH